MRKRIQEERWETKRRRPKFPGAGVTSKRGQAALGMTGGFEKLSPQRLKPMFLRTEVRRG